MGRLKTREAPVSHKLEDTPQGMEECFWCGRVLSKENLMLTSSRGIKGYVCQACSST